MDLDSLIRERAYLLWEQAGRPQGTGEAFWFAAMDSLAAEARASAPVEAPPKPAKRAKPAADAKPVKDAAKATVARRAAGAVVSSRISAKTSGSGVGKALTAIPLAAGSETPPA
jgi:hypothetical protein